MQEEGGITLAGIEKMRSPLPVKEKISVFFQPCLAQRMLRFYFEEIVVSAAGAAAYERIVDGSADGIILRPIGSGKRIRSCRAVDLYSFY